MACSLSSLPPLAPVVTELIDIFVELGKSGAFGDQVAVGDFTGLPTQSAAHKPLPLGWESHIISTTPSTSEHVVHTLDIAVPASAKSSTLEDLVKAINLSEVKVNPAFASSYGALFFNVFSVDDGTETFWVYENTKTKVAYAYFAAEYKVPEQAYLLIARAAQNILACKNTSSKMSEEELHVKLSALSGKTPYPWRFM